MTIKKVTLENIDGTVRCRFQFVIECSTAMTEIEADGNSVEEALDRAAEWLLENEPEHFITKYVLDNIDAYFDNIEGDLTNDDVDKAHELAEAGTIKVLDGSEYMDASGISIQII